jgi:hypothetical protein
MLQTSSSIPSTATSCRDLVSTTLLHDLREFCQGHDAQHKPLGTQLLQFVDRALNPVQMVNDPVSINQIAHGHGRTQQVRQDLDEIWLFIAEDQDSIEVARVLHGARDSDAPSREMFATVIVCQDLCR